MSLAAHLHGDPAGPPLLILHGLFGSGRNWTTVADRDREVILVWDSPAGL